MAEVSRSTINTQVSPGNAMGVAENEDRQRHEDPWPQQESWSIQRTTRKRVPGRAGITLSGRKPGRMTISRNSPILEPARNNRSIPPNERVGR